MHANPKRPSVVSYLEETFLPLGPVLAARESLNGSDERACWARNQNRCFVLEHVVRGPIAIFEFAEVLAGCQIHR